MIGMRNLIAVVFLAYALPPCALKATAKTTFDTPAARFEKTFVSCADVGNGVFPFNTQFNMFFVAHPVLHHLGYKWRGGGVGWINLPKDVEATVKSGVFEQPKHGKFVLRDEKSHEYFYLPQSESYVGTDRAVFWVEVQGRRYKVVRNLAVVEEDDPEDSPKCERIKFPKP